MDVWDLQILMGQLLPHAGQTPDSHHTLLSHMFMLRQTRMLPQTDAVLTARKGRLPRLPPVRW